MSRLFITGLSDGLGIVAAHPLVDEEHSIVSHTRNTVRSVETHRKLPEAEAVVTGDRASLRQMNSVAEQLNTLGAFDANLHSAKVRSREPRRVDTKDQRGEPGIRFPLLIGPIFFSIPNVLEKAGIYFA